MVVGSIFVSHLIRAEVSNMRPEARFIKWETAVKSLSTIKYLSL